MYIALKNPFRYRSYYYDFETGLYYLNSRYYDPEISRFINIDDITVLDITNIALNGINLYVYCLNNPVNEVDENGYFIWFFLTVIIIGALIGAGSSIINQGLSNGWDNINWLQVAFDGLMGGINGALIASGIGSVGLAISGGITGFIQSVGDQLISGTELSDIDWFDVIISTISGAIPGIRGHTGATNAKFLYSNIFKIKEFARVAVSKSMTQNVINAATSAAWNILKPTFFLDIITGIAKPIKNYVLNKVF